MTTPATRDVRADLLKGWAILGVLFIHMSFIGRFDAATLAAVSVLQRVFGWSVVAFFFCSGFLHGRSGSADAPLRGFCAKRARRLLVPWIGLSLIYKAVLGSMHHFGLIASVPVRADATAWDRVIEFVLSPAGPQLYFLPYLFIVAVGCHALVLCGMFRREWALWLVALALAAAYVWLPVRELHGADVRLLPAYAVAYLAGVLVAVPAFVAPIRGTHTRRLFFGAVAAASVGMCVLRPPLIGLVVPLLLLPAQSLLTGAIVAPVAYIGRHSGAIYLWHTPVVMPFLSILLVKVISNPWLLIPSLTVATVTVSLAIARCVRAVDRRGFLAL